MEAKPIKHYKLLRYFRIGRKLEKIAQNTNFAKTLQSNLWKALGKSHGRPDFKRKKSLFYHYILMSTLTWITGKELDWPCAA